MPTATIPNPLPLVRADGRGYTYAGESVAGFADRLELPLEARVRLARLAERYTPKRVSESQRELLASPQAERDATREPSVAQEGFHADEQEAARASEEGVYAELSAEQQAWVAEPGLHPALADATRYPVTLGQLHLLSDASERQLRHWTDEDLLPAHRAGAHRRYYSTAVARALLLAQMTPQQLAALIALRRGGEPGRRLAVLIGSVVADVAERAGLSERERSDVVHGARALIDHREALASADRHPGHTLVSSVKELGTMGPVTTPNRRTVAPHGRGWAVEKPGTSRVSSVHDTQRQAQDVARGALRRTGGGELVTLGTNGQIRAKDTVAPGHDPFPPRG
jgi:hypothetical protein